MEKAELNYFKGLVLSLALFAIVNVARGSEGPIRSVELELLWEKKVDFEYDTITPDANFERFVVEGSVGQHADRYTYLNAACEKVFEIQSSEYGKGSGKISMYDHPEYVRAKQDGTLSELNLAVTDFVAHSLNFDFLGVFHMYYDNEEDRFDRRFKFYEVDSTGNRELLWEKDSVCPDLQGQKSKKKDYMSWIYCLDDCFVANNGNVMLIAGNPWYGMAKRLLVCRKNGTILLDADNYSSPLPLVEFSLSNTGQFKYGRWYPSSDATWLFFNQEGIEINAEEYSDLLDPERFGVRKLPSGIAQSPSYSGRIISRELFRDGNRVNLVCIRAKDGRGHYITLYDAENG
ncbi:hypothetical protein K8T06_01140, partial [bacterium]|nr:hypothetical protein [bacterium]